MVRSSSSSLVGKLLTVVAVVAHILTALAVLHIHLRLHHYAYDDAYIHFRIARHFVEFGAPYFNPGEPINASSSTGWILMLSALLKLGLLFGRWINLAFAVAVVNAMATVVGAAVYAALISRLAHRPHRTLAYWAVLFIYIALTIQHSIGLMETVVALLIVGIGLHLLVRDNSYCFLFFSVAVFFRLELLLVLVLVLIYGLIEHRFRLRDMVLLPILGAAPFMAYSLYFFGSFVPHTIRAKSIVYSIDYASVFQDITNSLLPDIRLPFWQYAIPMAAKELYLLSLIVLVGAILAYGTMRTLIERAWRAHRLLGAFLIGWSVAIAGAYLSTRTFIFPWYIPLYAVPLVFSVSALMASNRSRRVLLSVGVLATPVLAILLVGLLQVWLAASGNPAHYQHFERGARVRLYREIGASLFRQYPNTTLLAAEIGGLGDTFRGRIIDGAGLVSPQVLRWHPMSIPDERNCGCIGAIPVGCVREMRPGIIVGYDAFVEALLRSEVPEQYVHTTYPVFLDDDIRRTPVHWIWGSKQLHVFIRKDLVEHATATGL